jgi:translation initiation factor 3 subunit B
MYTFQGRFMYQQNKEKLFQLFWRPHPPSLLTEEKKADVAKNLKTFSKKYDALDDKAKDANKVQQQAEREKGIATFNVTLNRIKEYKASKWEVTGWKDAWEALEAISPWDEVRKTVEEELERKEEEIID